MTSRRMSPLAGKVCIVTGATRGIGKGIALQLAEKGATVYITGRTLDAPKGATVGGSLRDTAREIEARGGTCIPVQCDHSQDVEVERLFETVSRDQDGQLDILVNNAYSAVNLLIRSTGKKFWELPPSTWDDVNNVGLRNHYICSVYAARIMVPRKQGLIVNVSSAGGLKYLFNTAYGIGKEGCDRMAADCAHELRKHNVAFVSLWPGAVDTEMMAHTLQEGIENATDDKSRKRAQDAAHFFSKSESPEFSGQCIARVFTDPDRMAMSGKILLNADLGRKYGLQDKPGNTVTDIRQIKYLLYVSGYKTLAAFTPGFIRIPKWMIYLAGNKFY